MTKKVMKKKMYEERVTKDGKDGLIRLDCTEGRGEGGMKKEEGSVNNILKCCC